MAKGEIAHDEQFRLLPQCLQNPSAAEAPKCIDARLKGLKESYQLTTLLSTPYC